MGPQTISEDDRPKENDETLPHRPAAVLDDFQGDEDDDEDDDDDVNADANLGGYSLLPEGPEERRDQPDGDHDTGDDAVGVGWATFDSPETSDDGAAPRSGGQESNPSAASTDDAPPPLDFAAPHFLGDRVAFLPRHLRDASPPRVASLNEGLGELWAGEDSTSRRESDPKQMEDVKRAMSKIVLPPNAVPDWAARLSEEEWRKALRDKLKSDKL